MKNHKRILTLALALVLVLGLLPAGALAATPTDALAGVAYYGDRAQCTMNSDQALAFAKFIRSETESLEKKADRNAKSDGPGSVHTYVALVDLGGGKPALFFAGGKVTEPKGAVDQRWKERIRADGCDWANVGQYGVWEYKNGTCKKLSMPSAGLELFYNGSYIFVGGPIGSVGEEYDGRTYLLGNGVLSETPDTRVECIIHGRYDDENHTLSYKVNGEAATEADYINWTAVWDVDTKAPMGHRVDGGVGGTVWGMAPALATADALTNYAQAKGMPAVAVEQDVVIDGEFRYFKTYAIQDGSGTTNYVRLRDLAAKLTYTDAKFNVGWDGAVNIETCREYDPGETSNSVPFSGDRSYETSTAPTLIDGKAVELDSIILKDDIGNGYTYYKLRDLGKALGFNVGWDNHKGIFIETDKPYDANN